MAQTDERVVAGAVVGSLAYGRGDRWSDLDLTFAVDDEIPIAEVLDGWTRRMVDQLDGETLFDLPSGETIYRVFLLPGGLQVDLSFTPASRFGAAGPNFELLFGEAHDRSSPEPPSAGEVFGWAIAYAREARACIERERWWQAEFSINAVRDHALTLACLHRGLPTRFGRGYDALPADVLEGFKSALVMSLARQPLMTALRAAVDCLFREAEHFDGLPPRAGSRLLEFLGAVG